MNSVSFAKTFQPYRSRYTRQFEINGRQLFDGYSYEWKTISKPLKGYLIQKAIEGILTIGWFTNTLPNVLGVDLDDHKGTAWTGQEPSPRLLGFYNQITNRLPLPSLLVQSPHGLHLYWLLKDRIPANVLQQLAKSKLQGVRCEIRPTPDCSLRIPENRRILDPVTFLPKLFEDELTWYHPALLFDDGYLPETIRTTLQQRKTQLRSFRLSSRIEKAESLYTPIVPGQSNETLNALIPLYKGAGLTVEESAYRIDLILQQSYVYDGELRNSKRLEQRVRSYYRKDVSGFVPKPRAIQYSLLNKPIVDHLVGLSPFASQRDKSIERFLSKVLQWCDWHDWIMTQPKQISYMDFLYPWYRKNRKEGYYPLPQSLLRNANERYFSLMDWLLDIGFLIEAPYKYAPNKGICKYYSIEANLGCICS
ncbi:MAG: hypothetical protein JXQ30_16770 [Spirochaetes bacterium]|nr:hypothetical protein [Spirochaetota bacterium]